MVAGDEVISLNATRPYDGEIVHRVVWWDSLWINAESNIPACYGGSSPEADSLKCAIQKFDGTYWDAGPEAWGAAIVWNPMTMSAEDYSMWSMYLDIIALEDGTYHVRIRAWYQGNRVDLFYSFVVTSDHFLVIEREETVCPEIAGEPFDVTVTAYLSPGIINDHFSYACSIWSTADVPSDVVLPSPFYLISGTRTVSVTVNEDMHDLILAVESPASGYAPGATDPFDIIPSHDCGAMWDEMADVPCDQGGWLTLSHTMLDIAGEYFPTVNYEYQYMDITEGIWHVFSPDTQGITGDTIEYLVSTNNSFNECYYKVVVEAITVEGCPFECEHLFNSGMPIASVDNIPPAPIANLWIRQDGSNTHLSWDEVTTGVDTFICTETGDTVFSAPEILPADNMKYDIYRCIGDDPYDTAATYSFLATSDFPWYNDPIPVNPIDNPTYYYVIARDISDQESAPSEIVGRVSYEFGNGYSHFAVPFDVEFGSEPLQPSELVDSLAPASIAAMYHYDAGSWYDYYSFGIDWFDIVEGCDALWANGTGAARVSIAGNLLDPPVYTLDNTPGGGVQQWNQVFLPLHLVSFVDAIDIYESVDGVVGCGGVAHRIPGGSWYQLVYIGALDEYWGNFDVYVGQAYMIWPNADGDWPPPPSKGYSVRSAAHRIGDPSEIGVAPPKALVGYIEGNWESAKFELITSDGVTIVTHEDPGCTIQNGKFLVQVGNVEWNVGDELVLRLYIDDESIAIPVELDDNAGQYVGKYQLGDVARKPGRFALSGAFPNPFNPVTEIKFDVAEKSDVEIAVFDVNGKKRATIVSDEMETGNYSIRWNGTDSDGNELPAGVYFCRMKAGEFSAKTKLYIVK